MIRYSIRVTNGSDQEVNVMRCQAKLMGGSGVVLADVELVIGFPAGLYVGAKETQEATGSAVLL